MQMIFNNKKRVKYFNGLHHRCGSEINNIIYLLLNDGELRLKDRKM